MRGVASEVVVCTPPEALVTQLNIHTSKHMCSNTKHSFKVLKMKTLLNTKKILWENKCGTKTSY